MTPDLLEQGARRVEADAALGPAAAGLLELADGQGVEEFVGQQQQRAGRQVFQAVVPGGTGQCGFLAGAVLAPGERVAVAGVGVAVEGYAAGFNAPPVELAGEGQGLLLRLEALP